jgi:hypothetical protein
MKSTRPDRWSSATVIETLKPNTLVRTVHVDAAIVHDVALGANLVRRLGFQQLDRLDHRHLVRQIDALHHNVAHKRRLVDNFRQDDGSCVVAWRTPHKGRHSKTKKKKKKNSEKNATRAQVAPFLFEIGRAILHQNANNETIEPCTRFSTFRHRLKQLLLLKEKNQLQ